MSRQSVLLRLMPLAVVVFSALAFLFVASRAAPLSAQEPVGESATVESAAACPADMISYWKLDETGGPTYFDFLGDNHGSCGANCPAPVAGQVMGAQQFGDPIAESEINVLDDPAFDWAAGDSFSIQFWVKADPGQTCVGTPSDDNEVVIGRTEGAGKLHWWLGCQAGNGKALFQLRDSTKSGDVSLISTLPITDGDFHHIVGVRDANANTNSLYVDGQLVASQSITYTGGFASVQEINFGWLDFPGSSAPKYHFTGVLDEVAIFSQALTADRVQQYYQESAAGMGYCSIPDIAISKDGDQTVMTGDAATFTIAVTNTGAVTLTNVSVTDAETPDCNRTVGDLGPGETDLYTCQAPNVTQDFVNSATAVGTIATYTVSDTDTAVVTVSNPSIAIVKDGDQVVRDGGTATFTIVVSNTSGAPLTNVQVTDEETPACERTFASIPAGAGESYTCQATSVTVSFTNTATVAGTLPNSQVVTDSDSAIVTLIHPAIAVTKDGDQTIVSGGTATFTITVENTGDVPLANVQVTDSEVPACDWTIGALNPGAALQRTCQAINVTAGFTNTATATGTPPVGPAVSDSDTATVAVQPEEEQGRTLHLPLLRRSSD